MTASFQEIFRAFPLFLFFFQCTSSLKKMPSDF